MLPLSWKTGGPSNAEGSELAASVSLFVNLLAASRSSAAIVGRAAAVSAFGYSGAQAQTRYWWLR